MKCSDEISVGDYVRTDNGIIGKYVKYRGWQDTIETNNKWIGFDIDKDIVKHSKDIIDLIEEGDYVNGWKVEMKAKDCSTGKWYVGEDGGDDYYDHVAFNKQIKTVVTKEQIKQIEFRIKE